MFHIPVIPRSKVTAVIHLRITLLRTKTAPPLNGIVVGVEEAVRTWAVGAEDSSDEVDIGGSSSVIDNDIEVVDGGAVVGTPARTVVDIAIEVVDGEAVVDTPARAVAEASDVE